MAVEGTVCTEPHWLRKEQSHFLYTWPTDAINKQAAPIHASIVEHRRVPGACERTASGEWRAVPAVSAEGEGGAG